ncbi:MAG: YitT family protein [Rhodobacteraceae bacterium]|nr:YitT family protein [Paracoccaceae bacterium]
MKFPLSLFDLQGLFFGVLLASLGIVFLKSAGLVSGQTAGLALLLSYVLTIDFGPLFFGLSLPFLILAWTQRGRVFAIRTIAVVIGLSGGSQLLAELVVFDHLDPLVAAICGGASAGIGLIAIFRHNASAGGMTILAVLIEARTGVKAGWVQLLVDAAIFAVSALVLDSALILYSLAGAITTNMIVVWNFDVEQSGTGRPGYGKSGLR